MIQISLEQLQNTLKLLPNRLLGFCNLLDRKGNLSISNVGVIVLITKIAMASTIDWPTVSGLLIALMNYGHKRKIAANAGDASDVQKVQ